MSFTAPHKPAPPPILCTTARDYQHLPRAWEDATLEDLTMAARLIDDLARIVGPGETGAWLRHLRWAAHHVAAGRRALIAITEDGLCVAVEGSVERPEV